MQLSGGVEHTGILTWHVRLKNYLFHYWDIVLYLKRKVHYQTRLRVPLGFAQSNADMLRFQQRP
jgi:hypothetical protein